MFFFHAQGPVQFGGFGDDLRVLRESTRLVSTSAKASGNNSFQGITSISLSLSFFNWSDLLVDDILAVDIAERATACAFFLQIGDLCVGLAEMLSRYAL